MTSILIVSGSLRAGSFNTALANAAAELAPEGVETTVITLHGIPLRWCCAQPHPAAGPARLPARGRTWPCG